MFVTKNCLIKKNFGHKKINWLCIHENVEIFSPRYTNSIYLILHCRQECYFEDILTLSLTGIARAWLLRGGGADSAPAYNSMKGLRPNITIQSLVLYQNGGLCKNFGPNLKI